MLKVMNLFDYVVDPMLRDWLNTNTRDNIIIWEVYDLDSMGPDALLECFFGDNEIRVIEVKKYIHAGKSSLNVVIYGSVYTPYEEFVTYTSSTFHNITGTLTLIPPPFNQKLYTVNDNSGI